MVNNAILKARNAECAYTATGDAADPAAAEAAYAAYSLPVCPTEVAGKAR